MFQWLKEKFTSSPTNTTSLNQPSSLYDFLPTSRHLITPTSTLYSDAEWLESLPVKSLNKIDKNSYDASAFVILNGTGHLAIRVLGYPPTLIKTQLQSLASGSAETSFSVTRDILAREGVQGLFKGVSLSLTLTAARQLYFYLYEHIRIKIGTDNALTNCFGTEYQYLIRDASAAFGASAIFQVLGNPVDVVVQRIMVQRRGGPGASSALNIATLPPAPAIQSGFRRWCLKVLPSVALTRDLWYADGIRAFYRGFLSSVVLFSTSAGLWWGSYDYFLDKFTDWMPPGPPSKDPGLLELALSPAVRSLYHSHSWLAQHCAAALSSMLSVVLTQPIDVCRTRLMVTSRANDGLTARSVYRELVKAEGWTCLLRGIVPRAAGVVPASVMTMAVYTYAKLLSIEVKKRKEFGL